MSKKNKTLGDVSEVFYVPFTHVYHLHPPLTGLYDRHNRSNFSPNFTPIFILPTSATSAIRHTQTARSGLCML